MGLENLKSIFAEGAGQNNSELSNRHGPPHPPEHTEQMESTFGNIGMNQSLTFGEGFSNNKYSTNFVSKNLKSVFSDINTSVDTREDGTLFGTNFAQPTTNLSYDDSSLLDFGTTIPAVDFQNTTYGAFTHTPPEPFPEGFTLNFNTSGYSFGDGELGNSKLIAMTTQNYGTLNQIETNYGTDTNFSTFHPSTSVLAPTDSDGNPIETLADDLKGFQFSPLSVGNTGYGQYSSDTPGYPQYNTVSNLVSDDFDSVDETSLAKTYDSLQYDPRSPITTFNISTTIKQNPYVGTLYDDSQTIDFSIPYGSKTFSVDRPMDDEGVALPPYSEANPPIDVFSYGLDDAGNSTTNIATMYDDLKSIGSLDTGAGGFNYPREFNVGEPGDRPSDEITFKTPPLSSFMIPNETELTNISEDPDDTDSAISKQFDLLYNTNHTAKPLKIELNPFAKKENFSLSQPSSRTFDGNEPYIVTDMGSDPVGGRSLPMKRSLTDLDRLSKFLFSKEGLNFFLKQNLLGFNSIVQFSGKESFGGDTNKWFDFEKSKSKSSSPGIDNVSSRKLLSAKQRFRSLYLPTSTLAASARLLGYATPNVLVPREFPLEYFAGSGRWSKGFGIVPSYGSSVVNESQDKTFAGPPDGKDSGRGGKIGDAIRNKLKAAVGMPTEVDRVKSDVMTVTPLETGDAFEQIKKDAPKKVSTTKSFWFEEEKHGMPFYFKDLRDGTYVIFRAYINSLTEDVSPEWTGENYIGRSEPVYIYERAERTVNFTLKLFANTELELNHIYAKLDRLNSMCYPQYVGVEKVLDSKVMMKPPLISFRMGELFGNALKDQTAFIKSIAYSYDDNSPWETRSGKRVPKYVEASISLQILHDNVPSLLTTTDKRLNFRGFAGTIKNQASLTK